MSVAIAMTKVFGAGVEFADAIYAFGKKRYQAFQAFITIICLHTGIIFGGVPRDLITRNHATKEFGKYCHSVKQCSKAGNPCKDETCTHFRTVYKSGFNNPNCNPETFNDRNLEPNDFDVYITEENFQILLEELSKKGYTFIKTRKQSYARFLKGEPSLYFVNYLISRGDIQDEFLVLLRMIFGFKIPNKFSVDFVVNKGTDKLYPPFGNPDFECNQLIINFCLFKGYKFKPNLPIPEGTSGYQIIPERATQYERIVTQIINKVAVIMMNGNRYPEPQRFFKMHNDKGYKFVLPPWLMDLSHLSPKHRTPIDFTSEDKCIICLGTSTDVKSKIEGNSELVSSDNSAPKENIIHEHYLFQPCKCSILMCLECYRAAYNIRSSERKNIIEREYKCVQCKEKVVDICAYTDLIFTKAKIENREFNPLRVYKCINTCRQCLEE
jgi:hypothetical protein